MIDFTFHHQLKDEKQRKKEERNEENFQEMAEDIKPLQKPGLGWGGGLCNFMSQVMGKTHFIGFKRIS